MNFLGFRPVRPPITPALLQTEQTDKAEAELRCAIEKHKAVSRAVITRSLDAVDQAELARQSLKAIFDRATVPGMASAEGAWELASRGRKHDDHH